jgi:hypothetical protein
MFIEFYITERPADKSFNVAWALRTEKVHSSSIRGRGRRTRPVVEFNIKMEKFGFLDDLFKGILDLRGNKGAVVLFLYLGFCSSEVDFFNMHKEIFSIDYDTHENNYFVLIQQIIEMVDEGLLEPSIWVLQKEAEKMFLECFI